MTEVQKLIAERLENPGKHMYTPPIKVNKRGDLLLFARLVGVRPDWHEPDEQEVTARFFGNSFDNAGPWAVEHLAYTIIEEHHVVLYYKDFPTIAVNLATLFAWATEEK